MANVSVTSALSLVVFCLVFKPIHLTQVRYIVHVQYISC